MDNPKSGIRTHIGAGNVLENLETKLQENVMGQPEQSDEIFINVFGSGKYDYYEGILFSDGLSKPG
jgi:hypothetical protein